MFSTINFGTFFRTVFLALGFVISASAGNSQQDPAEWTKQDSQATAHALALAREAPWITLDLSDPQVAHFLKRHYEFSGFTKERYPGLHQLMSEQQRVHADVGVTLPATQDVSGDLTYSQLATLVLTMFESDTPGTYTAAGAATMEAAADDPSETLQIAYTSLCFYDSNSNPLGTCATTSSYNTSQYFATLNNVATSDQNFSAAFAATYYDATNKVYIPQLSVRDLNTNDYPAGQTISDPVILHASNNSLKTALVCTSRSVNANANPGTCDYGTYGNTDVLVTMEGSVTYQDSQTPKTDGNGHLVGTGSVFLLNTVQGGACQLSPAIAGSNFFSQSQVTYNAANKTVNWNFDNLDFGGATTLICGGDGTNIQYTLTLQVEDETNPSNTYLASQVSVPNTVTPVFNGLNKGSLATPMLRLVAGCLHPDTQIAMAGGSSDMPISQILGEGELVKSMGGVETHVIGTVIGEEETLFLIEADNGMTIQASAQHPFVMADGSMRAAADLQAGDRVLTRDGPVQVASVQQSAYGGPVHNLMLSNVAEVLNPNSESFYANGFLVGGHQAQQNLVSAKKSNKANVLSLLPEQFVVDYASHLEDHANR